MSDCIECKVLKQKLHEAMCALQVVSRAVQTVDKIEPIFKKTVTGPFDTREELRTAVEGMIQDGLTGKAIAKVLGVSDATVSRIRRGDLKQDDSGLPVHAASNWKNRTA